MTKKSKIDHYSDKEALDFHLKGKSGKIEINSSKPLTTKRDLSLSTRSSQQITICSYITSLIMSSSL